MKLRWFAIENKENQAALSALFVVFGKLWLAWVTHNSREYVAGAQELKTLKGSNTIEERANAILYNLFFILRGRWEKRSFTYHSDPLFPLGQVESFQFSVCGFCFLPIEQQNWQLVKVENVSGLFLWLWVVLFA